MFQLRIIQVLHHVANARFLVLGLKHYIGDAFPINVINVANARFLVLGLKLVDFPYKSPADPVVANARFLVLGLKLFFILF